MTKRLPLLYAIILFLPLFSFSQVKILFDCTKAETAGNADWVIDADAHNIDWTSSDQIGTGTASNPQRYPTPAQSTVTSGTAESYWEGALSAWGIDCVNYGYEVETLTPHDSITYGNASHAQDLMNYKVYVIDEPNIRFTQSEKNAILNFVKNGGGLFMISDHNNSDRNNDGWDSPNIWNDFLNTVTPVNPFGIKFDLEDFSPATTNVSTNANDSLTRGPYGNVAELSYSGATIIHIYPDSNSTATGDIWMNGVSQSSHDSIMFAHAHFGRGKVAAIADSSPEDDGTGNPSCQLYVQYTTGDNGSDRKLFMNAIIWLAEEPTTVVGDSLHLVTAADTTLCSGNPITMTAAGATTYLWQPGGATTASITVTPATSGIYIVTGTTGSVSKNDTVHITVDAFSGTTPQITANGSLTFCSNGSVQLSAPSESSYAWSNGLTTQNITATQTGTYTATVTDANHCHATTNSLSVTSDAFSLTNPQITTNGPVSFCTGGSVGLSLPAGYTYQWNNSSNQQSITVSQSGTFYATLTDGNNCHASSDTVTVSVSANLTGVQISPSGPQTVCTGNTLALSAPSGYVSYLWSNGSTTQNITVSQQGSYYVTVSTGGNCHGSSDTAVVSIDNFSTTSPAISNNGALTFCQGGSVMLSAGGGTSYQWSNGGQQPSTNVTQTGVYKVTITDGSQCVAVSQPVNVLVNPLPQITFQVNPDSVCSTVNSLLLNASPTGGTFTGTGVSGMQFEPGNAGTGTHQVTYSYTDSNGCNNTASSQVTVYICTGIDEVSAPEISVYPNPSTGEFVFHANQDFSNLTIRIFDETGREVIEMPGYSGNHIKLNLNSCASGIYIAVLEQNNTITRMKLVKSE